jgi:hypothetical protein
MRARREKFDTRRPIDFTSSQSDWLDAQADELGISVMAVVRKALNEYMKHVSLIGDTQTTTNSVTNSNRPKELTGLYTVEQVAQLINAINKK